MRRAPAEAIRAAARAAGHSLLPDDAWAQVLAGETTRAEAEPILAMRD
jgi:hypothetical protein